MSPLGQNITTGIEVEEIENRSKKISFSSKSSAESLILSRFYSISLLALVLVYH